MGKMGIHRPSKVRTMMFTSLEVQVAIQTMIFVTKSSGGRWWFEASFPFPFFPFDWGNGFSKHLSFSLHPSLSLSLSNGWWFEASFPFPFEWGGGGSEDLSLSLSCPFPYTFRIGSGGSKHLSLSLSLSLFLFLLNVGVMGRGTFPFSPIWVPSKSLPKYYIISL